MKTKNMFGINSAKQELIFNLSVVVISTTIVLTLMILAFISGTEYAEAGKHLVNVLLR